ncbi:hypothetical protein GCM10007856_17470 [Azospirillum oryzae]|nr:hypothetical protein GCM10007856_17470 [Azospirillum oryzae]
MPHIRCLQSACVVQCTTDDAILWRGWGRRDAQVRNLQVGAVLNVPCFLSTSMCAVEAGRFVYPSTFRIPRFAPLLTRITVPVGSPARHLPGREGEILFPAHSSLKLTAVIADQINTAEGLESGFIYEMEYQQPPTRYLDCNNL